MTPDGKTKSTEETIRELQEMASHLNKLLGESRKEYMEWKYLAHQREKDIDRLNKWVSDLHSGMYVNCVYCGHRYGPNPGTPVAMADVLKEHIAKCPEHPLSKANARLAALATALNEIKEELEAPDYQVERKDLLHMVKAALAKEGR
jgi:hypothetical protein